MPLKNVPGHLMNLLIDFLGRTSRDVPTNLDRKLFPIHKIENPVVSSYLGAQGWSPPVNIDRTLMARLDSQQLEAAFQSRPDLVQGIVKAAGTT